MLDRPLFYALTVREEGSAVPLIRLRLYGMMNEPGKRIVIMTDVN